MEYNVCRATTLVVLVSKVNEWIGKGWKPQGGVSVDAGSGMTQYSQAIVKRKERHAVEILDEGDPCPACNIGSMQFPPVENCSFLIAPPCSACVDNALRCDNPDCGYTEGDEI